MSRKERKERNEHAGETSVLRKPDWLRVRAGHGAAFRATARLLRNGGLHSVCEEALCPNRGECWEHGRATLMILGDACSRSCRFCGVATECSGTTDPGEPRRVAEAVREMGLRDVVITSATRDDLPDGGASIWAETIRSIRAAVPGITIEVLVPDFRGEASDVQTVLGAGPDVFGHNLETVPSLYASVRPQADYERSLGVLAQAARQGFLAKTGIMVGLGEERGEILSLMADARQAGVEIFYAGQYLQPTRDHLPVARYVEPTEFEVYKTEGTRLGFAVVVSGPLVRSSYHSGEQAAFAAARRGRTPG